MARKKASDQPPAPLRRMPKRAAAPGNMNETQLQRTQEATARAGNAKPSDTTVADASTPKKSKKPAAEPESRKATPKKAVAEKATPKREKPALKKVKGSKVEKAKPETKSKKATEPDSPIPDVGGTSESDSDYTPIAKQRVTPKKKTTKAKQKTAQKAKEKLEEQYSDDEVVYVPYGRPNVVTLSSPSENEDIEDLG